MKKNIMIGLILGLTIMIPKVNALSYNDDGTITTYNGATMTQEEYDFLHTIYNKATIEGIRENELERFLKNKNISFNTIYSVTTDKIDNNGNIIESRTIETTKEEAEAVATNNNLHVLNDNKLHNTKYEPVIIPRGVGTSWYYSTNSKEVKMCYSYINYGAACQIIIESNWFTNPTIRQYDIIGARWNNSMPSSNLLGFTGMQVNSNNTQAYYENSNNLKIGNYGLGLSMNLFNSGNSFELSYRADFASNMGNTAYGSYQHANNSNANTLAKSQSYTFNSSGLGGVFNHTYSNYYDGMQGVINTLDGYHYTD